MSKKPSFLEDLSKPFLYDFNDPDSQFTMFNKRLAGHALLTFDAPMNPAVRGEVTAEGEPVPFLLESAYVNSQTLWYLGLRLGKLLSGYDEQLRIKVSGFQSADGGQMDPVELLFYTPSRVSPLPAYAAHEAVAYQAARDGCVLLRNEHQTLPLRSGETLNFVGDGIFDFRLCAYGAGKITPRYAIGLLEAARQNPLVSVNEELISFYAHSGSVFEEASEPKAEKVCQEHPDGQSAEQALLQEARKRYDTAVVVISRASGENMDNTTAPGDYHLSRAEEHSLQMARAHFSRVIVLLNTGYPINLSFISAFQVDAVLWCGYGGMFAGQAVMDLLTGRCAPSGRLTDTWAEEYEQYPSSGDFYDSCRDGEAAVFDETAWFHTVYTDDIYLGYRYFETFPDAAPRRYPFGFGLTYTSFSHALKESSFAEGMLRLHFTVTNTGERSGRDVLQVYLSKPCGMLSHPAKELAAYEKTRLLAPGEVQELSFEIPQQHMECYSEETASYFLEKGTYRVFAGENVRDAAECASFEIAQTVLLRQVQNRMRSSAAFQVLQPDGTRETPAGAAVSGAFYGGPDAWAARRDTAEFPHSLLQPSASPLSFSEPCSHPELISSFVGGMDVKTLARLCVCASHGWGMEGRGEAGRLFCPGGYDLPEFIVADGNSGVNLHDRNIGMPSGATLCSSFDRALIGRVGEVIGEEAAALGIHMILAPGMNLHRNPLCGRHPEYFSEDPYLAGTMAGSYCKGLESTGVGGCYKHLIANNAETGRKKNQSLLTERAIRELYFKAFQYALEVHESIAVMTAYNAVNGVFTSCDAQLIQGLLFEECGYTGFVMTDWCSYDTAPIWQMCRAGISWITPGSQDDTFTSQIETALKDGRIELSQLQENVRRLILGLVRLQQLESIQRRK